MELLNRAVTSNDFGMRLDFPWSDRHRGDTAAKVDSRNISREELQRLSIYLGCQIPVMGNAFVGRIENPYLWSRYVLQYEEMRADSATMNVKEEIVIHATSISAAYEIAENNFDWRLVKRYRYGRGVSFARHVNYANQHATQKDAYIVAGVLVASSKFAMYQTQIPPPNFDTTTNRQKSVYVKYYDNDFYPYYIAY